MSDPHPPRFRSEAPHDEAVPPRGHPGPFEPPGGIPLQIPANAVLFTVLAAIALHQPAARPAR